MIQVMATDSIGTRIKLRRQQLRLTQEELARRLGVHPSSIVNWEKDKHFPSRFRGAVEAELGISLGDDAAPAIAPDLQRALDRLSPAERAYVIDRLRRQGGESGSEVPG